MEAPICKERLLSQCQKYHTVGVVLSIKNRAELFIEYRVVISHKTTGFL